MDSGFRFTLDNTSVSRAFKVSLGATTIRYTRERDRIAEAGFNGKNDGTWFSKWETAIITINKQDFTIINHIRDTSEDEFVLNQFVVTVRDVDVTDKRIIIGENPFGWAIYVNKSPKAFEQWNGSEFTGMEKFKGFLLGTDVFNFSVVDAGISAKVITENDGIRTGLGSPTDTVFKKIDTTVINIGAISSSDFMPNGLRKKFDDLYLN